MKKILIILLITFSGFAYATNEIQTAYDSGNTLYAIIRNNANVWNEDDGAWETWVDANIADYDNPLSNGDDLYYADFNDSITAGNYTVIIYLQAGGSPHISNDIILGSSAMPWDGTYELEPSNYNIGFRVALRLKLIDVRNSAGNGVNFWSTGNDGIGFNVSGDGTSSGFLADSAGTGHGIEAIGGTGGHGLYAYTTTGDGHGFFAQAQGTGYGAKFEGVKDIDANEIDVILVDTNELQTDWTDGGRLDVIIDKVKKSGAGIR